MSYSRSRGLFAGVAIDGATIHIDHRANAEYYAVRPGHLQPGVPASAVALAQLMSTYAPPEALAPRRLLRRISRKGIQEASLGSGWASELQRLTIHLGKPLRTTGPPMS